MNEKQLRDKLIDALAQAAADTPGSEILAPTSPWEILRYLIPEYDDEGRTFRDYGTYLYGVVYRNAKWRLSFVGHALELYKEVLAKHPELRQVKVKR